MTVHGIIAQPPCSTDKQRIDSKADQSSSRKNRRTCTNAITFVQVLRFFGEDDWSALLPSTVDFRGTDQIQAVRQPFVVPLQSSL